MLSLVRVAEIVNSQVIDTDEDKVYKPAVPYTVQVTSVGYSRNWLLILIALFLGYKIYKG